MDVLHFHCVICGKSLQISSRLADGLLECPSCLRVVPIPSPLNFPHEKPACLPALPREILAVELKILCPKCDTKIRLDARLEGYEIVCPVCQADFRVPFWSRPPNESRPQPTALSAAEIEFLSASLEPVTGKESAV